MTQRKRLLALTVFLAAVVVSAGCGSSDGDEAATTDTLPAGPPCFGLVQADKLPDWAGGLAFGESHSLGGGNFVDLTSTVGCEIEEGVLRINKDGRFIQAFVDDCESFESSDIPAQELRPAGDDRWTCSQPAEGGGMLIMQREG